MRTSERTGALRRELEDRIKNGSCVYCRAPAAPDQPLTREHVIPQARGGRRRDSRIIVPACARCNGRRGCQEVVLFLLARPRRIAAFLEYLSALPPETVRQLDLRIFAELYAAVWLLGEVVHGDGSWRDRLRDLCSGRRLHRRRYAARRAVTEVGRRLERVRSGDGAPSCLLPDQMVAPAAGPLLLPGPARVMAALVGTLSMVWEVPAERVMEELSREIARGRVSGARGEGRRAAPDADGATFGEEEDDVVSLDGWRGKRAGRRRRVRVDRRGRRGNRYGRGRAA